MLLELHRAAHWAARKKIPLLPQLIYVFNRIVFAVVLPPNVAIWRRLASDIPARVLQANTLPLGVDAPRRS